MTDKQTAVLVRLIIGLVLALACGGTSGCSSLRNAISDSAAETRRLVDRARQAEQQGEHDRAERLLNRALRKNPDDVEAHRQLADVLIARGDFAPAVEHLRSAVIQDPEDADGLMRLARLIWQQGRGDDAAALLDTVLRIDPGHVEALRLKATIAERRGRDDTALAMYYRILCSAPNDAEARLAIAAIYLKRSQPERATPLLRAVCRDSQTGPQQQADACWSLGMAYGQQHRWADAADALTHALTPFPSPSGKGVRGEGTRRMTPDDWYRLAYARYRAGDLTGSRQAVAQALEIQPGHEAAGILASRLTPERNTNSAMAGWSSGIIPAGHTEVAVPCPLGWSERR